MQHEKNLQPLTPNDPQRVHIITTISSIHRPQSRDAQSPSRPKYLPDAYLDHLSICQSATEHALLEPQPQRRERRQRAESRGRLPHSPEGPRTIMVRTWALKSRCSNPLKPEYLELHEPFGQQRRAIPLCMLYVGFQNRPNHTLLTNWMDLGLLLATVFKDIIQYIYVHVYMYVYIPCIHMYVQRIFRVLEKWVSVLRIREGCGSWSSKRDSVVQCSLSRHVN